MRKFSSYGPVSKKRHFYVPRTELVNAATLKLTGDFPDEGGHYITVWAPRQCGKSWIMNETLYQLNQDDRFDALKLELESLKHIQNPDQAVASIGNRIAGYLDLECGLVKGIEDFEALFKRDVLKKPLILICDEFDALPEPVISCVVSIFRNIYNVRLKNAAPSSEKEFLLHGVALIGVRSVLGIENVKGSPFNVQRSMHIPNLTLEEVQSMFQWYEKESGQTLALDVVERIHEETRGQPGLVSWFGELLTEGYEWRKPDRGRPIVMDDFGKVFSDAIHVLPNNNILNIISKAKQEPYRETVLELFKTRDIMPFRFDDPRINFLYMNGVIDRDNIDGAENAVRFSSPFVQKRLFNYFSREIFRTMDHLYDPMTDIEAVAGETDIDVSALIALYQTYLDQNRDWLLKDAPRRKTDLRIFEAVFHFNLYMYLKVFFQDKGGDVFPEFPTGNGKVDILIRRAGKLYALELKSFKDRYAYKLAIHRSAEYAIQLGIQNIFLIFFIESIDEENRRELETPRRDDGTGVDVQPIFVETGNVSGWEGAG